MNFQNFIISILSRSNIKKEYINKLSHESNLSFFEKAFIEKSFSPTLGNNYEVLEFYGDSVINYSVIKFLRKKFPEILNIKYLIKIKHILMSKEILADFAKHAGFLEFIKINYETLKTFDEKQKLSLYEDVFEAFFGSLKILGDKLFGSGLGNAICYKILSSFFKDVKFSLKYEDLVDPKTRYKEFCDKKKWTFTSLIKTYKNVDQAKGCICYKTYISGYPLQKVNDEGVVNLGASTLLYVFSNDDEVLSQYNACEGALRILKEKYNMTEEIPDPYQPSNKFLKDETNVFGVIKVSKKFINFIDELTEPFRVYLKEENFYETFRVAFIHQSYNLENYELLKTIGDNISTSVLLDYIRSLYPEIKEVVIATRLKHNFMYNKSFASISEKLGFWEHINISEAYAEKIKDYEDGKKEILESVLQGFLGAIDQLSKKEGMGYHLCKKFLKPRIKKFEFSIAYDVLFDPVTRMKELCDMRSWKFNQIIETKELPLPNDKKIYETAVYGFIEANNKKTVLAICKNMIKDKSKNEACEEALKILREKYKIKSYKSLL